MQPKAPRSPRSQRRRRNRGRSRSGVGTPTTITLGGEGLRSDLESVTELGSFGKIVATPGGSVSPTDCERWPGSPYCGGGFDPRNLKPGFGIDEITINDCEILFKIRWFFLGFEQPSFTIGWRKNLPGCEPPPPPEPPPEPPPAPPGERWEDLEIPIPETSANCAYGFYFVSPNGIFVSVYAYGSLRVDYVSNPNYPQSSSFPFLRVFKTGSLAYKKVGEPARQETSCVNYWPSSKARESRCSEIDYSQPQNSYVCIQRFDLGQTETISPYFGDPIEEIYSSTSQTNTWYFADSVLIAVRVLWSLNGADCTPKYKTNPPFPHPYYRKMDCCNLTQINTRLLRKIYAVLQPTRFLKFNDDGTVEKVVGKIPKRFLYPDETGEQELAGYSDALEALVRTIDRISGFWPATVTIEDSDPFKEGKQSVHFQIQSVSDGIRQILQALGGQINDRTLANRTLVSILYETGLIHQIAASNNAILENLEEYLDYKVEQKKEELPMAFTPTAGSQIKPFSEEDYLKLLHPTRHPIAVTRINEPKLHSERLMELLKHATIASGALGQRVPDKNALQTILAAAETGAVIDGFLTRQNVRQALGLGSEYDLDDWADEAEANYTQSPQVDKSLHGEPITPPKSKQPRIRNISKRKRRRDRAK